MKKNIYINMKKIQMMIIILLLSIQITGCSTQTKEEYSKDAININVLHDNIKNINKDQHYILSGYIQNVNKNIIKLIGIENFNIKNDNIKENVQVNEFVRIIGEFNNNEFLGKYIIKTKWSSINKFGIGSEMFRTDDNIILNIVVNEVKEDKININGYIKKNNEFNINFKGFINDNGEGILNVADETNKDLNKIIELKILDNNSIELKVTETIKYKINNNNQYDDELNKIYNEYLGNKTIEKTFNSGIYNFK